MKEFNNPFPQPEDPGRALDPRFEEDPDISVEFVDGTFYQASSGSSLVAIIADYPGLLPVSHVSNVGASTFRKDSFVLPYLMTTCRTFYRKGGQPVMRIPQGPLSKRCLDKVGLKGRWLGATHRRRGIY